MYWMILSNMLLPTHHLLTETLPVRKGWVFGNLPVTNNKLCQLCNKENCKSGLYNRQWKAGTFCKVCLDC